MNTFSNALCSIAYSIYYGNTDRQSAISCCERRQCWEIVCQVSVSVISAEESATQLEFQSAQRKIHCSACDTSLHCTRYSHLASCAYYWFNSRSSRLLCLMSPLMRAVVLSTTVCTPWFKKVYVRACVCVPEYNIIFNGVRITFHRPLEHLAISQSLRFFLSCAFITTIFEFDCAKEKGVVVCYKRM